MIYWAFDKRFICIWVTLEDYYEWSWRPGQPPHLGSEAVSSWASHHSRTIIYANYACCMFYRKNTECLSSNSRICTDCWETADRWDCISLLTIFNTNGCKKPRAIWKVPRNGLQKFWSKTIKILSSFALNRSWPHICRFFRRQAMKELILRVRWGTIV